MKTAGCGKAGRAYACGPPSGESREMRSATAKTRCERGASRTDACRAAVKAPEGWREADATSKRMLYWNDSAGFLPALTARGFRRNPPVVMDEKSAPRLPPLLATRLPPALSAVGPPGQHSAEAASAAVKAGDRASTSGEVVVTVAGQ